MDIVEIRGYKKFEKRLPPKINLIGIQSPFIPISPFPKRLQHHQIFSLTISQNTLLLRSKTSIVVNYFPIKGNRIYKLCI